MSKKIFILMLVAILIIIGQVTVNAAVLFSDDFEDGNSTGWSTSSGTWAVVSDGNYVYKQSSTSATGYSYVGTSTWNNYSVQAQVKLFSFNGTDRYAGVCSRFASTSSFYAVRLNNLNKLELIKKVSGTTTVIISKTYTVQTGVWYTIKLSVSSNSLNAYVNNILELTATDSSLITGKIGFTCYNTIAEFDNVLVDDGGVVVTPTPSVTPTPTITVTSSSIVTPTPTITPTATATITPTISVGVSPTPTITPIVSPPPGNNLYVATNGLDTNPGTISAPFKTVVKAVSVITAGSTIYVRGGTYLTSGTITLSKQGSASSMYYIWAYPGEYPVLDFSAQTGTGKGFSITGNYWYLKGLEVKNAGDNGIYINGNHNIIEFCSSHHNKDSGLQIGLGKSDTNAGEVAAYNQVINCDSYDNFDPSSGGSNADGFSCKLHPGRGNIFRGCRAWENSDDGWDCFLSDYPILIENCWTWHNGDPVIYGNPSNFNGNGNGIKLGGDYNHGAHIVRNCVSFDNKYGKTGANTKGFDQNHNMTGCIIYNCTAWGNEYNYSFWEATDDGSQTTLKNNVAFDAVIADTWFAPIITSNHNTWDTPGITANSADFKSLDVALAKAPRNADGSLPNNDFAKLVSGSDLIDMGIDVGIPYNGTAPDLGAFESQ